MTVPCTKFDFVLQIATSSAAFTPSESILRRATPTLKSFQRACRGWEDDLEVLGLPLNSHSLGLKILLILWNLPCIILHTWRRYGQERQEKLYYKSVYLQQNNFSEADGVVRHPEMLWICSVYCKEGGSPQELIPSLNPPDLSQPDLTFIVLFIINRLISDARSFSTRQCY